MSAIRLSDADRIRVALFDVVGIDSENLSEFVRHVGLSSVERDDYSRADTLPVTHMGPPLGISQDGGQIQLHGTLPLTSDEQQQVNLFVDDRQLEYESQMAGEMAQYTIRPPVVPVLAPDRTVRYYRYSCAGFVLAAYGSPDGAGINLLPGDESQFPVVALDTICTAYPDLAEALQNPQLRTRSNLSGDGPWPIVLPGYVFHALNRPDIAIRSEPYCPQPGDEYFPAHR